MEISNLFQSLGDAESPAFLCLIVSTTHVQAFLLQVSDDAEVTTLAESKTYAYTDNNNLVLRSDEALQDLGEASEDVNQVLFGVDQAWVTDSEIHDDKKKLLQKLASDLGLEAKGYVVSTEALISNWQKSGGISSGLLILTTAELLSFLVLKDGQLEQVEAIGRSAELAADFTEGLARVTKWTATQQLQLPPRVVLASLTEAGLSLEEYRQYLLSLDWQQFPVFLDVPTVELLPPEKFAQVMIQQAAVAAKKSGLVPAARLEPVPARPESADSGAPRAATSFGVPISPEHQNLADPEFFDDFKPSFPDQPSSFKPKRKLAFSLPKFSRFSLGKSAWSRKSIKVPVLLGAAGGFLTLLGLGWWWLATASKVLIEVERQTRPVSVEVQATLADATEQKGDQYFLAAAPLTITVEQTVSQQATGVEEQGEKATGTVTLFNKTEAQKTLAAGTKLSTDQLAFVLDEEVTLPAASVSATEGGAGEVKQYGQVEAKATAAAIGEASNITANTNLTVAQFSTDTYSATSKSEFSGGSSEEVQVMSKEDQAQLLEDVKVQLTKAAEEEIKNKLEKGQYFTPLQLQKINNSEYSAKVGEEAGQISLTAEASFTTLTYTASDVTELSKVVLQSELPQGYELSDAQPDVLSRPVAENADEKTKTDEAKILLQLTGQALPQLNADDLLGSIQGKSFDEASRNLQNRSDVKAVRIFLQPTWSSWVQKTVPTSSDRVQLQFKP